MTFTSNTKSGLINEIARNKQIKQASKNIMKNNPMSEDLLQELFLHLCELPEEEIKLKNEKKYLYFYCIKFLDLNGNEKHIDSTFKLKHKVFSFNKNEFPFHQDYDLNDIQQEEEEFTIKQKLMRLIPSIEHIINSLHWYDRMMFQLYIQQEKLSTRNLAKKIGIPHSSVAEVIDKVKTIIRLNLNERKLLDD